jgi:hypothetical protein
LVFGRRRWAIRVVKRAGFLTRSREGKILVDLLVGASKKNPKDLPTAEQVLFAALRMFHNQAAIARMTESLGVSAAVHGPLDFPELLPNRNGLFAPNGLGLAWGRSIRNVINANVSSPCHAAI